MNNKVKDEDCRRAHKLEYLRSYNAMRREIGGDDVRDYNRVWMSEYRHSGRERKNKEKRMTKAPTFEGNGYAERQMAKSLALAGKVDTTL